MSGQTASGAGGLYPKLLCGLTWLYSFLHLSIKTLSSKRVSNISMFNNSYLNFPLNDSLYRFFGLNTKKLRWGRLKRWLRNST